VTERRARRGEGGGELPGLVACPAVAELLANVEAADRANARATALLADLHRSGQVEEVTGVAVEVWLLTSGVTGSDRRMLTTAAVQLERLPAVRDGFDRRLLTWGQVRTLCLLAERLSDQHAAELDLGLAPSIERYAGADPDALLAIARQIVAHLRAEAVADDAERIEREPFLHFQPRVDGSGAKVYGDLDGVGYGLAAAALDAGAPLPSRRRELVGQPSDTEAARERAQRIGRRRADRLVQLCADDLARRGEPFGNPAQAVPITESGGAEPAPGEVDRTRSLAPEALLIMTVDQLVGRDPLPAELVTKLAGGRLKVATPTARRWIDEAGARLRTIVLDETGRALGVGRRTRVPPGWMRDTQLALHATCAAPGCRTAAAAGDDDHHAPVHPTSPNHAPGRTDLDNLGRLCRSDNLDKERQGWRVRQLDDGTVAWRHPRSGLATRTVPWAVRRAAAKPPDRPPRTPGGPGARGGARASP
jgi:hypothetical protein